jgi:hypothetical protein
MAAITLPKGTLLQFNAKDPLLLPTPSASLAYRNITDHNRSQFSVDSNRIERTARMANGSLRKIFIADKKNFSMSWDLVPSYRTETVDGYWGAEDLRTFYASDEGKGTFDIRINFAKNGSSQASSGYEQYTVSITNCSFVLVKRGIQAHWNISLSLEEV